MFCLHYCYRFVPCNTRIKMKFTVTFHKKEFLKCGAVDNCVYNTINYNPEKGTFLSGCGWAPKPWLTIVSSYDDKSVTHLALAPRIFFFFFRHWVFVTVCGGFSSSSLGASTCPVAWDLSSPVGDQVRVPAIRRDILTTRKTREVPGFMHFNFFFFFFFVVHLQAQWNMFILSPHLWTFVPDAGGVGTHRWKSIPRKKL